MKIQRRVACEIELTADDISNVFGELAEAEGVGAMLSGLNDIVKWCRALPDATVAAASETELLAAIRFFHGQQYRFRKAHLAKALPTETDKDESHEIINHP